MTTTTTSQSSRSLLGFPMSRSLPLFFLSLCYAMLVLLLSNESSTVSANSFDRLKFSSFDSFPRSYKWDLACHRIPLSSSFSTTTSHAMNSLTALTLASAAAAASAEEEVTANSGVASPEAAFVDVDYRTSRSGIVSIQFSTTLKSYKAMTSDLSLCVQNTTLEKSSTSCSLELLYQLVLKNETVLNETLWQQSELTIRQYYFIQSVTHTVPINMTLYSVSDVNLWIRINIVRKDNQTLTTTVPFESSSEFMQLSSSSENTIVESYQSMIELGDRQMYNRSQCLDFSNVIIYNRAHRMHDYTISLIIHFIFLVPMVIMCFLTFVTCTGTLGRRRFPTSIIGSISVLILFIVSLPFDGFVRFYLWKNRLVQDPNLNVWYNFVQVLGIIIPLIVAVTSYSATMIRYLRFKVVYRYAFNVNKKNTKTSDAMILNSTLKRWKILNSQWLFWPLFFIGIGILYVCLAAATTGLIYANRMPSRPAFVHMYTALDVLNIDYLVVLGILLLIFLVDSLMDIKKFKRGLVYFYWTNDPLLFRLEALVALFFFGAMVAGIVIFMHFKSVYAYSVALCFDFAYFFAMLLFGNVIISVIEVYRWIVNLSTRRNGDIEDDKNGRPSELLGLLTDEHFYKLFAKYCLKELSAENLSVFTIIEQAKRKGKLEFVMFEAMYLEYIKSGSNFEVNVKSSVRSQISAAYEKSLETKEAVDISELDQLYWDIVVNLEDTFNRFSKTAQYHLFTQEKQVLKEMFHIDSNAPLQQKPKKSGTSVSRHGSQRDSNVDSLSSSESVNKDSSRTTSTTATTITNTTVQLSDSSDFEPISNQV